ncbi:siderophore-interacting protein [Psychromonas aquatilis]|uniref:Siderophore-interacting protein n=1 Tax=Psychromonas aquatilis TaxID=2005072 RepID=A0ABU9GNK2_9GAMM
MKKPMPKKVQVIKTQKITENLQRIVLMSEQLDAFPDNCDGGYFKLLFNAEGGTDLSTLEEGQRPIMRTYTIRKFSREDHTIEVDFVRHSVTDLQCGFAARWAINAKVGDTISINGPGLIEDINPQVDWFFMAADMTSLPALSAKIAKLPEQAQGYAVIKVIDEADIQALKAPANIKFIWLTEKQSLIEQVRALTWLPGDVSVWAACEFDSMRALRTYFRNEKQVNKENLYLSSYWKHGVTEDGHKVIKRKDALETQN